MSEWQDIETAPLDEAVLIYLPARPDWNGYPWGPWVLVATQYDTGGWSRPIVYDDSDLEEGDKPSHWMPLPAPPSKAGESVE